MGKRIVIMAIVLICMNLSGCLNHAPAVAVTGIIEDATESQEIKDKRTAWLMGQFKASQETTAFLRTKLADKTISVGTFESFEPGLNKLTCRLDGLVRPPLHVPFSEMIRNGMIENLKSAGAYSESSSIVLKGRLDAIDFSSHSGNWTMTLTLRSSNGKSLTVSDKYEFETGFGGQNACNNVRDALMPAVHSLLDKVVRDPEFPTLL